jgi:4-hydroxythreonine-4-phosphate dehydrogenase
MGDAAGIGPEIIIKALQDPATTKDLDVIVIGDAGILKIATSQLKSHLTIETCASPQPGNYAPGILSVIDLNNVPEQFYAAGKVDPVTGKAAVEYIESAVKFALDGAVDAIASAPVNKEAMHQGGAPFAGVTELIAHLVGSKQFQLVSVFGKVRLFLVTNHVSLRTALDAITKETVLEKLRRTREDLKDFGIQDGAIAVAALNPHGGEGGAMGTEEIDEIVPAMDAARKEGIRALGPFPADTIFVQAQKGEFDAVLAMYHDQGNIASKLMDFGAGVTVVTGLPIIRTSVAHGTAFDIAGQGIAAPDTFIAAIKTAGEIAVKRGLVH